MEQAEQQVVLSGIRATGRMHLGNYLGALEKFARLSRDPRYHCLYFIADLHTLTTHKDAENIRRHAPDIALDILAAGVDPEQSVLYVQSRAPEVTELAWYLECLTPYGNAERIPTFKDKADKHPDDVNAGLFNYPMLMAADILGPRAHLVPVGEDQVPHLEFTRELARRFNSRYGDYFPIPEGMTGGIQIPGLTVMDPETNQFGKMGKSEAPHQTIYLNDSWEISAEKLRVAPTDPARRRLTDPGAPQKCAIYWLHTNLSSDDELRRVIGGCTTAGISCTDCKSLLAGNVRDRLREFTERRAGLASRPEFVREVLEEGSRKVSAIFRETAREVGDRMGVFR